MKKTISINDIRISRAAKDLTEAECVHWDGESDGDDHACCREMRAAAAKHRCAVKAYVATEHGSR